MIHCAGSGDNGVQGDRLLEDDGVEFGRALRGGRVPSGEGDHDGETVPATGLEDVPLASTESVVGQGEAAVAVPADRIDAREEEHDVGNESREDAAEMPPEPFEVLVVTHAVREADVERRAHLARRIVALTVHRERKDVGVALEDRRRAVALVHVEVDDERAARPALPLQDADRHGHVVEHTESLAVIRERVMRAAREVGRDPVVDGCPGGVERALHCQPGATPQRGGPRHADPANLGGRQGPGRQVPEIRLAVDPPQVLERGLRRRAQVVAPHGAGPQQAFGQQWVLGHRERVHGRQRHEIVVVVGTVHPGFQYHAAPGSAASGAPAPFASARRSDGGGGPRIKWRPARRR